MDCIGVFCSSYNELDKVFFEESAKLGKWIGITGRTLIYGGTNCGIMEHIATEVKKYGGTVTGVIPSDLCKSELASKMPDKIITVDSLAERKKVMIDLSDILIALPGGFGTLDEAFTTIASNRLGYHDKELLLCNIGGIFDDISALFDKLYKQRFAPDSYLDYYKVFSSVENCIDYLENK
ncbi:MAG: TIGR00730 family Rossman fold protein [Bacteroidales bacterium]